MAKQHGEYRKLNVYAPKAEFVSYFPICQPNVSYFLGWLTRISSMFMR